MENIHHNSSSFDTDTSSIWVRDGGRSHRVNFHEIISLTVVGSFVHLQTESNNDSKKKKPIMISSSLRVVLRQINSNDIVRVGRGLAVNINKISSFTSYEVTLNNGQILGASTAGIETLRSRVKFLKTKLPYQSSINNERGAINAVHTAISTFLSTEGHPTLKDAGILLEALKEALGKNRMK